MDKEAPSKDECEFVGNVELLEGDAIYLPRGWWHDAGGALEPSAHLTVVVPKRTGISFLSWIVDEVRSDVVARIDIPRFSDDSQLQDYAVELREAVAKIITAENIKKYLSEHDQNADARAIFGLPWVLGQRPAFPADLRAINMVPRAQVDMIDDHVIVQADNRRFVFDRSAFGALNYVFAVTETDLDTLARVSGLPQDDLLDLLDELQDNGLVASVVNANEKHAAGAPWRASHEQQLIKSDYLSRRPDGQTRDVHRRTSRIASAGTPSTARNRIPRWCGSGSMLVRGPVVVTLRSSRQCSTSMIDTA